jgi:hypothetical protein
MKLGQLYIFLGRPPLLLDQLIFKIHTIHMSLILAFNFPTLFHPMGAHNTKSFFCALSPLSNTIMGASVDSDLDVQHVGHHTMYQGTTMVDKIVTLVPRTIGMYCMIPFLG